MKKILLLLFLLIRTIMVDAQTLKTHQFEGRIDNTEYHVYIVMNFDKKNIVVPGQEIFGELPGYFGSIDDTRKWLFTNVKMIDSTHMQIEITNDYGSEDLIAILSLNENGTYTLTQQEGSALKIARNRKWVKIPKELILSNKK